MRETRANCGSWNYWRLTQRSVIVCSRLKLIIPCHSVAAIWETGFPLWCNSVSNVGTNTTRWIHCLIIFFIACFCLRVGCTAARFDRLHLRSHDFPDFRLDKMHDFIQTACARLYVFRTNNAGWLNVLKRSGCIQTVRTNGSSYRPWIVSERMSKVEPFINLARNLSSMVFTSNIALFKLNMIVCKSWRIRR